MYNASFTPPWRWRCAALLAAITLAGCDMVSQVKDGMANANAAADQIERAAGVKPGVHFNYQNGQLTSVTVSFAGAPKLGVMDLERASRAAVMDAFKAEPRDLVIAFSFPNQR